MRKIVACRLQVRTGMDVRAISEQWSHESGHLIRINGLESVIVSRGREQASRQFGELVSERSLSDNNSLPRFV